jgi:signal transduction histidine kinase
VVVRVEDTGMGIAKEYLPFIFQRFWRSDRARSRQIEGSGLGLAIASAITKQYGGKIKVSSKVDIGSCFQVYLPRA